MITFVFLVLPSLVWCQQRGQNSGNTNVPASNPIQTDNIFAQDTTAADSIQLVVVDTSDAIRTNAYIPFQESFLSDTLLTLDFTRFDPLRKLPQPYVHAGNVGTQAFPLLFQTTFNPNGRIWRDEAFRPYLKDSEDFDFYRLTQAITRARFYFKPITENGIFNVDFGRAFANNVQLALHYLKGSQESNFTASETLFEDLKTGLKWADPERAYQAFYIFEFSRNEAQQNNGLANDQEPITTLFTAVSVNSSQARTNIRRIQHTFRHSIGLKGAERTFDMSLFHQFRWYKDQYKFSDTGISNTFSNNFYAPFNLLNSTEGIRMFSRTRILENQLGVQLVKHDPIINDEPTASSFLLQAGIKQQLIRHDMEPINTDLNGLALFGYLDWKLLNAIQIQSDAFLGFGDLAGAYQLHPRLSFKLKSFIDLQGGINIQATLPSYHQQVLFVNQQEVWANGFNPVSGQKLYGHIKWKKTIPFWVGLSQESVQNYIYVDQAQNIRQESNNINIQQLQAGTELRLWKIHLDNQVYLQNISSNIIRLPRIIGNHQLYYKGYLFKRAMWTRIGADLRFNDPYYTNGFQPVTGMFYIQDNFQTPWQFNLDAFFSFKIQKFRFTFRMMDLLAATRTQFLTYQYPYAQEPLDFRLGISWDFID